MIISNLCATKAICDMKATIPFQLPMLHCALYIYTLYLYFHLYSVNSMKAESNLWQKVYESLKLPGMALLQNFVAAVVSLFSQVPIFPIFSYCFFLLNLISAPYFISSICTICPIFFVVENLPALGFLALDGFPVKRYIWESDSEWIGFALREAAPLQPGRCKHLWNSLLKIHLTSFCQPDSIKRRFCAFPYHVGGCTLDVTFNYLEYNGRSAVLIGLIMSTQSAIVSFYDLWCATSSLAQPYQL